MTSFLQPISPFSLAPTTLDQPILPWSNFLNAIGNQYSFISVNLGQSSAPEVEREVLAEVGSYGKQLGRIGDAMAVMLKHFKPEDALTPEEGDAIDELVDMLRHIGKIKKRHGLAVASPPRRARAPTNSATPKLNAPKP